MTQIYDLQQRADVLRKKTATDSISPEEVGGLHADTLAYIANMERYASSLGIKKVYTSVSEMNGDESPVSSAGMPLKAGQLVTIFNAEAPDAENSGEIYAFQNPGWLLAGRLDSGNYSRLSNIVRGEAASISDNIRSPYTFIGNFATWAEVQTELDRLHNSDGGADNKVIGEFRVLFDGRNLLVRNWVQNWATGVFTQTVEGSVRWNGETMEQSLQIATYERTYNEGSGWGEWEEGTAKIELAQELSTEEGSEKKAISQKAVTVALNSYNQLLNGFSHNRCVSDAEVAGLVDAENRKLGMVLTYDKYVNGKFSVLIIGTKGYSTGGAGNFYATIDGEDYIIPYTANNFNQFKDVRSTIIDYFSSNSLAGWTIIEEGEGLRFTKEEGVDETFSFSAGRPLIEEFELSFTEPNQKYTTKDAADNLNLYLTTNDYGCAVNCSIYKNRSIKDIIDTITFSYKPSNSNKFNYGFIRTEKVSDTSFRAIFDGKWNGRPTSYDPNMIKDGEDSFDYRFPNELSVNVTKKSTYIKDNFGILTDVTYPNGENERNIVFTGKDTTDANWLKLENWHPIDKSKLKEELDKKSLWNKQDESIEIDISDGKPIFISLSQFASGNGIYKAEFYGINGDVLYSYSRNRYFSFANINVLNSLTPFLPQDTIVREDGWSYLYGYNFGAVKVKLTFNAGVPNSIYYDDLYILREDDFNRITGGIEDKFKINLATRDMATFAGGFNNILDKIFEKNPWQRCVFITPIIRQGILHWAYPSALPNTKCSSQVVEKLAKYWNQPCIDLSNLGLWVHKGTNNLKTIMPDCLHTATSSPDVRIYVTLEGAAGESGTLSVSNSDFCDAAEISISEDDIADTILQKIHDNIVVKKNMIKSLDSEAKSVLIHFDTSKYDANSYGNQKNNTPNITSTLDNVVVTVKQPDNQCRVVAKFLAAQLTSIFGDLKEKNIIWIGTSIPAGNTFGFATGEKYPELIAEITGCIMDNASYAGTCLRRYLPQFIGDDSENKPVLTTSWNYNTSEGNSKFLSLEGIVKKINTINSPYLIVFDHGINDEYDSKEWTLYDWENIYRED